MSITLADTIAALRMDSRFRDNAVQLMYPRDSNGRPNHVQIVASATTTTLYQISPGVVSAWLVGLWIYNDYTDSIRLTIGAGSFTQAPPQLGPFVAGFHDFIAIFPIEFDVDIQIQSDLAAASANEVEVLPLVFELGA